jgi:hypothetical protein
MSINGTKNQRKESEERSVADRESFSDANECLSASEGHLSHGFTRTANKLEEAPCNILTIVFDSVLPQRPNTTSLRSLRWTTV